MNILLKPKSLNFCWVLGCVHGQTFDLIESLRYECLDGFEALHHKAQSGKLTAAVWDQLIGQGLWEDLLQAKCLESSKRCTYEGCIRHLLNHWPLTQSIIPTKPSMCLRASAVLPIRKSSSWRTSTASLTLASGSVRVSQALRIELGVISENFARKTCKFGFTERKQNADRGDVFSSRFFTWSLNFWGLTQSTKTSRLLLYLFCKHLWFRSQCFLPLYHNQSRWPRPGTASPPSLAFAM